MAASLSLLATVAVLLAVVQLCRGGGKIEMKMIRFQSSCTEHLGLEQCDTYFHICIDRPGSVDLNSCDYKKVTTGHIHNDNSMDFGPTIEGVDNPVVAHTNKFQENQFMVVVKAMDDDSISGDDHIATLSKTVTYTAVADRESASMRSDYMRSGSTHLWFSYRAYCDAYYYTSECDVYCRARDDNQGHYTCRPNTGEKKCMRGWTGENCDIDINECQLGPCYHNASCTNLPGTYSCDCPNGFTGQNCDLIDTKCHSSPCLNGGNCSGTMDYYNCSCSFEWTGDSCETQVDFCEQNPCENNATCYATVGNYTCACDAGWTGYHCTTPVHACDSSPCQKNGECVDLPRAEYECNCPDEHEGKDCEILKNPCDPNPCLNSGSCDQLAYDKFNCSCVYGWEGDLCGSYLNVSSNSSQQFQEEEDGEGVDLVAILVAFFSALVIVICLLILLLLRRRRRQKKAAEARLTDQEVRAGEEVVVVASPDQMAFRNALYDETNRINSVIDRDSHQQQLRQQMPVPPTPTACDDELFYPTKPKALPDEDQGAVGGANPYHDIDGYMDPKQVDTVAKGTEKKSAELDTRPLAGGNSDATRAANPYANFEELKRRSMAMRDTLEDEDNEDNLIALEEENHYQELDEVRLDMLTDPATNTTNTTTTSDYSSPRSSDPVTSTTTTTTSDYSSPRSSASSTSSSTTDSPDLPASSTTSTTTATDTSRNTYDVPRSSVDSYPRPSFDSFSRPTSDDVSPTVGNELAEGYMNMTGTATRGENQAGGEREGGGEVVEVNVWDDLESSSDDDELDLGIGQEDIERLRREVMDNPIRNSFA